MELNVKRLIFMSTFLINYITAILKVISVAVRLMGKAAMNHCHLHR